MPVGLINIMPSVFKRSQISVPLSTEILFYGSTLSGNTILDSGGDETRTIQDDYVALGDGTRTITFNTNLLGLTFTYYHGDVQVAQQTLTSQVWTIPSGERVNYFEFSNGSVIIVPNTGDILFDIGIDGYHAKLSDPTAITAAYAFRNIYNELGYSTVQYYIDNGGDGNVYVLGSYDAMDASVLIPNTDLFTWEYDEVLETYIKVAV